MKKLQDILIGVVAVLLFASFFTQGWLSVALAAVSAITAVATLFITKNKK